MKNASILSIALLILSALFLTQTAQAQLNQNTITKSITTNTDFNNRPNAVFGIGATTGFNGKLDVQGAYGSTVASFRKSATGKGVSIVSDWPGVYFNSYYNGGAKAMAPGFTGIVNFDPDFGRIDFGITGSAATTANAAVDMTTRMCINKNGNVGIGTGAPVSRLDIVAQDGLRVQGFEPFLTLQDNNSNKMARIQMAHGDIAFFKMNVGQTVATPQMVIKDNGNVGIGNVSPVSKLDIAGQDGLRVTGYQPFYTLLDNNSNKSNRMQSANGDFILYRGVGTANYGAQMIVKDNGNVLIGTVTDHGFKLAVNGNIRAKEIRVQTGWADYVFADDYQLRPLEEVETFIKANKHLPDIQPAKEIQENGLDVAAATTKMMAKIEELTLYLIEMKKENDALKTRIEKLEKH